MKLGIYLSDSSGCAYYRVLQPHRMLRLLGVEFDSIMSMPKDNINPFDPNANFRALLNQISRYDIVLVQRITSYPVMLGFRRACTMLGKPLILEQDDDYLHLEPHNPCYYSTALVGTIRDYKDFMDRGETAKAQALLPLLESQRRNGLEEVKQVCSLADAMIVTTKELKEVYAAYNKNIHVIPNCVENVHYEKDYHPEECDESGNLRMINAYGMVNVPSYYPSRDDKGQPTGKMNRILRVGYTGTSTHLDDFESIAEYWGRLVKKWAEKVWFVFIGDRHFYEHSTIHGRKRRLWVPPTHYEVYNYNVGNLDIGIAPLQPTPFNMGKSDIKAVELASWGAAPVVPDYITYTRTFKHGETCMTYRNGKEFYEVMDYLIGNDALRTKIGNAARDLVANTRLEVQWLETRLQLYQEELAKAPGIPMLTPNKEAA